MDETPDVPSVPPPEPPEPAASPFVPAPAPAPASAATAPHSGRYNLIAIALVLGLAGGWGLAKWDPPAPAASAVSFAAAERRVGPSVVKIEVETPPRARRSVFHLPPGLATPSRPRRNERSLGSGLIVDSRGYIVTNRHVVHRAQRIVVTLPNDSRTYFGRLVGEDQETDLAVIKIDAGHPLPAAALGDSQRLAVGDWVVAIGSPFGLDATVTAGIVSALHRAMDQSQQFESFIQTDAPINPGNSGGPLVNLTGQVVGINTAIYTDTDGYQGVGFALPSHLVSQIYPQLVRQGHVTRGSIGIYFESTVDAAARRVYHLSSGVPLSEVVEHGPAAAVGLRAGDVITSLDGDPVANGDALMNAVVFMPIGRAVKIGYLRDGVAHSATVRVADRDKLYPDQAAADRGPALQAAPPQPPDLGLELKDQPAGPQVLDVQPDSLADRMGLQEDDIILELNRQPVRNRADLHRLASNLHPGDDVAVVVRRPNGDGTDSRWLVGGTIAPRP